MAVAVIGGAIILMSIIAFWKPNAILFMVVAGLSISFGLSAPDIISSTATTTGTDISVGLMLVAYSIYCLGMAFRMLFYQGDPVNE